MSDCDREAPADGPAPEPGFWPSDYATELAERLMGCGPYAHRPKRLEVRALIQGEEPDLATVRAWERLYKALRRLGDAGRKEFWASVRDSVQEHQRVAQAAAARRLRGRSGWPAKLLRRREKLTSDQARQAWEGVLELLPDENARERVLSLALERYEIALPASPECRTPETLSVPLTVRDVIAGTFRPGRGASAQPQRPILPWQILMATFTSRTGFRLSQVDAATVTHDILVWFVGESQSASTLKTMWNERRSGSTWHLSDADSFPTA